MRPNPSNEHKATRISKPLDQNHVQFDVSIGQPRNVRVRHTVPVWSCPICFQDKGHFFPCSLLHRACWKVKIHA